MRTVMPAVADVLVTDGQCQDEFLHCTDSCLEQERINVSFRRIRQNVASCPLLRTGVALFANVCAGSSTAVAKCAGKGASWGFWVLPGVLCMRGGTCSAGLPLHFYRIRATKVCPSLDTPSGRRSVEASSS